MVSSPDQALLLDAFSDLLLSRQQSALWRKVFLGGEVPELRFERRELFLCCTDAPRHGWHHSELVQLAQRFGGTCELPAAQRALMHFDEAAPALRAALLMQKIGADCQLRVAITAAQCSLICFTLDGQEHALVVGPEDRRAEAALAHASPGSLRISPEAYDTLEPLLAKEAGNALVATEFDTEEVSFTSVTLLPQANSYASTFAGLGLC